MKKAFYRKYRSRKLSEVVGQSHITTILESAIKKNKIAHAYLFTGPRGVGKTSVARILAHEINEIPYKEEDFHPDIIEIDAASNNGIDDIRSLRDQVQTAPFSAPKRVYIIDEVHMLSKQAFNALLKTLEEPPAHIVFIMATTDPQKLPATIVSRTQQFVFRYISKNDVIKHLRMIAKKENILISDESLEIIAERGGGSFRDSISLLDQVSSLHTETEIKSDQLERILGLTPRSNIEKLIDLYDKQDVENLITLVDEIKKSGISMRVFVDQFINYVKNNLNRFPHLISLLGSLVEIKNSEFIDIELLCVLIKPKKRQSLATTVTSTEKSEFIIKPIKQKPMTTQKTAAAKKNKSVEKSIIDTDVESSKITKPPVDFNWSDFLNEIKKENLPAYSIINKADHSIEKDTVKIFAGKPLYKKKLDTNKYRTIIQKAIKQVGGGDWLISVYAEAKPPESQMTADILNIMGGGEEVAVNEQ